jgi:hypothetical protein
VREEADRQRRRSGAQQRRRRDRADRERIEAEPGEIDRQQQADEAVAEAAQPARGDDEPGLAP